MKQASPRAERAVVVLEAYDNAQHPYGIRSIVETIGWSANDQEIVIEVLTDILADLRHFATHNDLDFDAILATATNHVAHERCPACETELDEDGYCTDVGCPNCGKAVGA